MTVHRFMSQQEFDMLIAGEVLENNTVHSELGRHSTSVGFCFFTEDPDEAIHRLSHIVCQDLCVTFFIPDHLLTESKGEYRDVENDDIDGMSLYDMFFTPPPSIWRKEYCLQRYSRKDVRIVDVTNKYALPVFIVSDIEIKTDVNGNTAVTITDKEHMRIAKKYGLI